MELLFGSMAWTWETNPVYFGTLHIIYLLLAPALAVGISYLLRNNTLRQSKIVFLAIGVFLIFTEVYKLLFYVFVVPPVGIFPMWVFSWQLCSIPMYICIVIPFIKNERILNALYDFLLAFAGLGGVMMLFEPSGAFSIDHIVLTFHSIIWHTLLLFLAAYVVVTRRAAKRIRDYVLALIVFFVCAALAEVFNTIVRFTMPTDNQMNMFFISPFQRTPIAVFKDIWDVGGPALAIPVYLFAISLGGFLFHVCGYFVRRALIKHQIKKYKIYRKTRLTKL